MTCVICKSLFTQEDDEMRKFSFNNASSDSNRLKLWKIACGKPESWKPSIRSRICARHFESKYFQSDSKFTNLLPNAVPTIDCHPYYEMFLKNISLKQKILRMKSKLNEDSDDDEKGDIQFLEQTESMIQLKSIYLNEDKICRICLKNSDKIDIYDISCGEEPLIKILKSTFYNINWDDCDNMPTQICSKCLLVLTETHYLHVKCIESDRILREIMKPSINKVPIEMVLCDGIIKDEPIDDHEYSVIEMDDYGTMSNENRSIEMVQTTIDNDTLLDQNSIKINDNDNGANIEGTVFKNAESNTNPKIDSNKKVSKKLPEIVKQILPKPKVSTIIFPNYENKNAPKIISLPNMSMKLKITSVSPTKAQQQFMIVNPTPVQSGSLNKPKGSFYCYICKKIFEDLVTRDNHLLTHPEYRKPTRFICKKCDKVFISSKLLSRHKKIHDRKPYSCDICGKNELYFHKFKHHIISHCQEKRFKCSRCPKRFTHKSRAIRHEKTHLTIKPCLCQLCGRSFVDATALKMHIKKMHEKIRPFSCDLCPIKFFSKEYVKKHMQVHLPKNRQFKCDIGNCTKAYSWKNDLHRHKYERHNILMYKCEVCNQSFRTFEMLRSHLNDIHYVERAID